MSDRSLQASSEGIKLAKASFKGLGITQAQFSERTGKSRSTVSNFFRCKPIDRILFVEICEVLKLDWQEIAVKAEVESKGSSDAIDFLVHEVREGIRALVREKCGTMRVLDMTQPIQLTGEGGIYTNVNILEKITGRRRLEIAQLFENADLEVFDRVGLSAVKEERIPGIQAVGKHPKLMVLGKPGAGKTTFLKYLAMNCIEGNFLADHVPIFITLKAFAEADQRPDLLTYIETQITRNAAIREIIQQGRSFVLFDGLDEVREEDTKHVLQEIEQLSQRFSENHFVITCRIASKEYTFQNFTEVEVADFDDEQITTFVNNWFRCKDPKTAEITATRILEKLDANKPIKELASSPILLTLLCLECEESLDFPKNRADLYGRGVKVLLSKWDASRKIERHQIYENLSLNRKEDLLSQLARKTFEQKDYFFKQRTVEQHIADYIINLPDAQTDSKALQLDSELVLKSIEAQHGLLVERAKEIYSFSHLTFHEYFTARNVVANLDYEELANHLTDKQWREVFLLTVNMLPSADRLLLVMKAAIDKILLDEELQACLKWLNEKVVSIKGLHNPCATRFFYLEFICRTSGTSFVPFIDFQDRLDLARHFDSTFQEIYKSYSHLGRQLLYSTHHSVERKEFTHMIEEEISARHKIIPELTIDHALDYSLRLITRIDKTRISKTRKSHENGGFFVAPDTFLYCYLPFIRKQNSILRRLCSSLPSKPIDTGTDGKVSITFQMWWNEVSDSWIEQLRNVMTENRNIGHNWKFTPAQKKRLQLYYDAHKLLIECLNSDCYISRNVRQDIEETLLLPITEIEARKKA